MQSDILVLYLKYEAEKAKEMKYWRKGGIAWKQHCATMRNLERKLWNLMKSI